MRRGIIYILIACVIATSLISCSNIRNEDQIKENEELTQRIELLEKLLEENNIDIPGERTEKEEIPKDKSNVIIINNENKFNEISFEVLEKTNTKGSSPFYYGRFVEFPYRITNNYDKEIKGIQGTLRIKDMFGEHILSVKWDISENPIPARGYIEVYEYGIDINKYNEEEMKIYNNSLENLIFQYEPSKVIFTDGTIID